MLCMTASAAHACLTVTPIDKSISISDEEALIIWDPGRHHEDFIRRADFDTDARDFGFLVPVPSTPTLAEADNAMFGLLHGYVSPPAQGNRAAGLDRAGTVDVVRQQEVAGYDASILAATDAASLRGWLRRNRYAVPKGFQDWVQPYIDKHWEIVAFKMSRDRNSSKPALVSSRLVRISFDADKPFYPYSEPNWANAANDPSNSRKLVVYILTLGAVDAHIGDDNTAWGVSRFVNSEIGTSTHMLDRIAKDAGLDVSQMPAKPTLTTFVDISSPRLGWADVWFIPSAP